MDFANDTRVDMAGYRGSDLTGVSPGLVGADRVRRCQEDDSAGANLVRSPARSPDTSDLLISCRLNRSDRLRREQAFDRGVEIRLGVVVSERKAKRDAAEVPGQARHRPHRSVIADGRLDSGALERPRDFERISTAKVEPEDPDARSAIDGLWRYATIPRTSASRASPYWVSSASQAAIARSAALRASRRAGAPSWRRRPRRGRDPSDTPAHPASRRRPRSSSSRSRSGWRFGCPTLPGRR